MTDIEQHEYNTKNNYISQGGLIFVICLTPIFISLILMGIFTRTFLILFPLYIMLGFMIYAAWWLYSSKYEYEHTIEEVETLPTFGQKKKVLK